MSTSNQTFNRDANRIPITAKGLIVSKTITYTGAANAGAVGATTLFNVTGTALVSVFAVCAVDLVGLTSTIEVGISGNTAAIIAQTTSENINVGQIWIDTAPATVETYPAPEKILTAGTDVIETVATAAVTAGSLTYYCLWFPISTDADVVAA